MYLPGVFSTNGRLEKKGDPVLLQYLQHSTHSPQKDMIWDDEMNEATFQGNPKLASLHVPLNRDSQYLARVASWRGEGPILQQLRIYDCNKCNRLAHRCSGQCCAVPQNKFMDVGNQYIELARRTCKYGLADATTCNGSECQRVEKLLPGSYIWFGQALTHDTELFDNLCREEMANPDKEMANPDEEMANPVAEDEFQQKWDRSSKYGTQSFVCDLHNLLKAYEGQIPKRSKVVLRCGGTLLYQKEICYVTIVTFKNDGCHDTLPPVNNPTATDGDSPQCDWSSILKKNGRYKYAHDQYPLFTPCSDHNNMVFAFHIPDGMVLSLPGKELVGRKPLETNHGWCHRLKYLGSQSATKCKEEEDLYHQQRRKHVSLQLTQCCLVPHNLLLRGIIIGMAKDVYGKVRKEF